MLRFLRLCLLLLFVVGAALPTVAQKPAGGSANNKAQKAYEEGMRHVQARNFEKALEAFGEAVKRDTAFGEAYVQAAGLYRILQKQEEAYQFYQRGLPKLPVQPQLANDYFNFAELSFERGQYAQAAVFYQNFLKHGKNARLAQHANKQLKNVEFAQKAMQQPVAFTPQPLGTTVNKFGLQYSPVLTADQRALLFTARQGSGPLDDENLYLAVRQGGEWQEPVSVSDVINSDLNEGAASLSGDGRVLVFTSCNRLDSYGSCDLYISYREGNEWSKPLNMGRNVNTTAWDSQPSLSADGRTIYFASNRKGGQGGEDLWMTRQQEDGTWSIPVNLGPNVNTAGRENSPFLHASGNTLYFATDGLQGMGGLDLFKVDRQKEGWGQPVNMGYPLNTHRDESSIFISADNKTGYYAGQTQAGSNIEVALLQFEVPEVWKGKTISSFAQGKVFDAVTKKPLKATVQVYDLDSAGVITQQVTSDKSTGEYTIVVNQGQRYALYVTAPDHVLESRHLSAGSTTAPLALDFYLQPLSKGAKAVLSNLFFDTGKATLRPESRTELDKLFQFLKANPKIKVEIAGHTDNVGQAAANQTLSEARAKAVVAYLVSKGAPASIFQAKGYGQTQPAAPNTSEENRQLNRRIELKIL
ncbi:OmpA family protein [Rufibacter psychrotolerans]|uniref:OmpA family protein n=1 Tax=Rufibacter psychrotolerans TaxID=2812556 RepID=UPI001F0740CE|nr:OmpA family protein [Rufibacter sp. SYSU D00308]